MRLACSPLFQDMTQGRAAAFAETHASALRRHGYGNGPMLKQEQGHLPRDQWCNCRPPAVCVGHMAVAVPHRRRPLGLRSCSPSGSFVLTETWSLTWVNRMRTTAHTRHTIIAPNSIPVKHETAQIYGSGTVGEQARRWPKGFRPRACQVWKRPAKPILISDPSPPRPASRLPSCVSSIPQFDRRDMVAEWIKRCIDHPAMPVSRSARILARPL